MPARSSRRCRHRRFRGSPTSIATCPTLTSLDADPRRRRRGVRRLAGHANRYSTRTAFDSPTGSFRWATPHVPRVRQSVRPRTKCRWPAHAVVAAGRQPDADRCSSLHPAGLQGSSQSPIKLAKASACVRWGWWPTVGRTRPRPGAAVPKHIEIAASNDAVFITVDEQDLGRHAGKIGRKSRS